MKKLRTVFCLLLLGLLVPALMLVRGSLPVDVQPLIEKKYGGWAGTLRLWVYEGWSPGSGSAALWLNRCVASFEKAHPGVYVQPEYVDAPALRDLGRDGILPPDLALFPPGVMENGEVFLPLDVTENLRGPLKNVGGGRAVPVMLGGYLWVYNGDKLNGIPSSWRDAELMPSVHSDEPRRLWSAALLALCSQAPEEEAPEVPSEELDLGLATFAPLPQGFIFNDDAWRDFTAGDTSVMLATQREVRRLEALDDQGKGVNWRPAGWSGGMFTDQVLFLGLVDRGDAEREPLCRAFAEHLLSDACQSQLHKIGAFAVTDAPSGYADREPLSILDSALRAGDLAAAPALGSGWRVAAEAIVREFLENDGDPAVLWPRLKAVLVQNPNISR